MKEIEKTYLVKSIPEEVFQCHSEIIRDAYIPLENTHAVLRFRQKGNSYSLTKKVEQGEDFSVHIEYTIPLDSREFSLLLPKLRTIRTVAKIRYNYEDAEVDIFTEKLTGLITADFEFASEEDYNAFQIPDWCLADITQEDFIKGSNLAGTTYSKVSPFLRKFKYKKLLIHE